MKKTWFFRKPTEEDIAYVIAHMREGDRRELKRWTGCDADWNLRHSIEASDVVYTGVSGRGVPMGIFGATRANIFEENAVLWLLTSDEADKRSIEFAKTTIDGLDLICREMSDVQEFLNYVDLDYTKAVKWIEWLGGTFCIKGNVPGRCGSVFGQFYLENPHYKED